MSQLRALLIIVMASAAYADLSDFLPAHTPEDQIVRHSAYILKYNEQYEQAEWVAYRITDTYLLGTIERTDDFRSDPHVRTGSASLADFKGSGFDRGHLAPAAAMKWSPQAMSESFYLSNMSPQKPGFNRGIWRVLEATVRTWAQDNEEIYVVTGPVLKGQLATIGPNHVAVPDYYYKVVLDYREPELKGIGFILANQSAKAPLQTFAVTIDSIERFTGIDFFPVLPDDQEEGIESSIDVRQWSLSARQGTSRESTTVQCQGLTQKGAQCKRKTTNENGYCWQHQEQAGSVAPVVPVISAASKAATVYTTKTGSKYHTGSCSYLKKSKIAISLEDAKKRVLTACSRCKPGK